ncbi:MAG: DeoR/GlpR transcriptional regulator [Selenomonadaceae bacterium]|nr:DeoR/GlpR transcriptional regulator [Selenomonadaceae bacterium]MBR0102133.1 DeoR/GlpR transcriptional regulator [Selenomonadaceae bacterium]
MKEERIHQIHELLIERKRISLDELCENFGVSKNTIRRDINELEEQGIIRKVYGGIVLKEAEIMSLEPFSAREIRNINEKKKIAAVAAALVNDGEVIYIDSGTTTMHLLPHLAEKNFLTIVTASVYVLELATRYSNLNVIATGGNLQAPIKALVGPSVLECIRNYNFSKIFLASTGITIEHGATNASPLECEVKRELVRKSCAKYLLVDNSKFDVASLMTYSDLTEIDNIITDKNPPEKYLDYFKANAINLILPE